MVTAAEAARRLGVRPATLYAYVSRGRIARTRGPDGRTSLFAAADVEALARRARMIADPSRSPVPVQIDTAVTELAEGGVRYRGHDAATLAASVTYEQVAELLWSGELPSEAMPWVPPEVLCRAVARGASGFGDSVFARLAGGMLGAAPLVAGGDAMSSARMLVAAAPCALGGRDRGPMAKRVAQLWRPAPARSLVAAIDVALVLLADHELASCAFAARVAASTRADLAECLAAGLITLAGPLHGTASSGVHAMLLEAEERGVGPALDGIERRGERVPGFGHRVYKQGDPRVAPLLAAVRSHGPGPVAAQRMALVDEVIGDAGRRIPVLANIDLALGALAFVWSLPTSAGSTIMAIARLAGMAAHVLEEYTAARLRYRVTGRYRPVASEITAAPPMTSVMLTSMNEDGR